jgi:Domain of unknown function (DUF4440)
VQLEKRWAETLEAHDTVFFSRILAEDFIATSKDGATNRAGMIKQGGDTSVTFLNTGDEDQKVRLYAGGSVGVVTGMVRGTIQMGSKEPTNLSATQRCL